MQPKTETQKSGKETQFIGNPASKLSTKKETLQNTRNIVVFLYILTKIALHDTLKSPGDGTQQTHN